VHTRAGFDAASCEIGKLTASSASLCAPDPVDAKFAKALTAKGTKAQNLVGKAKSNPKNAQKLVNRVLKLFTYLRNRVARLGDRGKITANCRAKLDALLAERQSLVQGLSTP
jgi:hypothetical protein